MKLKMKKSELIKSGTITNTNYGRQFFFQKKVYQSTQLNLIILLHQGRGLRFSSFLSSKQLHFLLPWMAFCTFKLRVVKYSLLHLILLFIKRKNLLMRFGILE